MYPIRSKIIKNTFFLGAEVGNINDNSQVQTAQMALDMAKSFLASATASVPNPPAGAAWSRHNSIKQANQRRYNEEKKIYDTAKANEARAVEQVNRAQKNLEVVRNKVQEQLRKEAEAQAKSAADMAKAQASAEKAASNTDRIVTLVTNSKAGGAVPPPEGTVTVVPSAAPSNLGKYLLIGGAAVAALVLMK